MEVIYKEKSYPLGVKVRKIGTEAPAIKVTMTNNEVKVIGMMAPKNQVMITLNDLSKYTKELDDALKKYEHKLLPYIVTSQPKEELDNLVSTFSLDSGLISDDFVKFSQKFGVNIDEKMTANSLFIIDKEGEIKYIQIPSNQDNGFDIEDFSEALDEVVNFKQKGHTHENWMGV